MVSASAIALAGCSVGHAQDRNDGGPVVSRSFAVGAFNAVEVAGPYRVTVTTGRQPGVTARGPEGALSKMVVEVKNGALLIHPQKRKGNNWFSGWSSSGRSVVEVAVGVPMIERAEIAGSGDLSVNRVAGNSFKGSIGGSGGLKLPSVEVGELALEIAGSGGVTASGRAANAKYEIAGSGNIDAAGVQTGRTSAEIAGSGNIDAMARDTADVSIAGSGNIRVTGGAKCNIEKAGSGRVRCS
jgi:hypothetical protein